MISAAVSVSQVGAVSARHCRKVRRSSDCIRASSLVYFAISLFALNLSILITTMHALLSCRTPARSLVDIPWRLAR
jgi:hypothetical protein